MRIISFLFFLVIPFTSSAQREKIDPLSIGTVELAEERAPIDLEKFFIEQTGSTKVTARLVENSLQWVKLNQVLLVPRVLLELSIESSDMTITIRYADQNFIPTSGEGTKVQVKRSQIFISLFEARPVEIFAGEKLITLIRILPRSGQLSSRLIDHSCAPYDLKVSGLEEDVVSIGCRVQRTGKIGEERPFLEVFFTAAGHRLLNDAIPPYILNFDRSGIATTTLNDHEGKESDLQVQVSLPKRLPRIKIAAGLGPYQLRSKNKFGGEKSQLAPTAMLYGNLTLNEQTSLRFFDSYTKSEATFHNWGTYFAWELAEFCDQRCSLTSLIGLQGVEYRFSDNSTTASDLILPQGFEFVYLHPFGNLNYKFSYGMFASFSGVYDYQNIWIRYGKKTFWELNFIEWGRDKRSASMLGISVGFPIGNFL